MDKHDKSSRADQGLLGFGKGSVEAAGPSGGALLCNEVVVVVDYHKKNMAFRVLNRLTGREWTFNRQTSAETVEKVLSQASRQAQGQNGRVVWIMESTTGWARVKKQLAGRCGFLLANVLQMPVSPKAYRKKTDNVDTKRMMVAYVKDDLEYAHQPELELRADRRLVGLREDLVKRRTALRNQVGAMIAHETWHCTANLWEGPGRLRLKAIARELEESDAFVLGAKLKEHDQVEKHVKAVEERLMALCQESPQAQALDAIKGIGPVGAVSIVARIGPIERFANAEELISYAGLAPGVRSSDSKTQNLKIGGGGTDKHLRHYLIEATIWARTIPRYQGAYERMEQRRGKKIARIVIARMLLRSIYKMLSEGVAFDGAAA